MLLNEYTKKSDPDGILLSAILWGRVHWNYENYSRALQLKENGYIVYNAGYHCGYYELTTKGLNYLKKR
jgi:hypothetical protein